MESDWVLSIDFGTTTTAAAITEGDRVELVEIDGAPRIPSVVLATESGELVVGDAAERQLSLTPERAERNPKRRIGDETMLLGSRAVRPVDAVAAIFRAVAAEAIRRQSGAPPTALRLTHPARWGSVRLGALTEAAELAGLPHPSFVAEPVAAAVHFADERVVDGDHVAVFDLGGGTLDTAVLRRVGHGFEVVGTPGGDDRLGGETFDDRLWQHLGARLAATNSEAWEELRFGTARHWRKAAHDFRTEVRRAKEVLSSNADYTIYLGAPVDAELMVGREELEHLISGDVERSVEELLFTMDRAGLTASDLAAVNLVGGSSRIPLVTRLVAERIGSLPETWGDPKAAVVLGAARAAPELIHSTDGGRRPQPAAPALAPDPRPASAEEPAAAQPEVQRRPELAPTEVPRVEESLTVPRPALAAAPSRPRRGALLNGGVRRRPAVLAPLILLLLAGGGLAVAAAAREDPSQVLSAGATTTTAAEQTEDGSTSTSTSTSTSELATDTTTGATESAPTTLAPGVSIAGGARESTSTPGTGTVATSTSVVAPPPGIDGLAIDGSSMNGGPFSVPQCQVTASGGRNYSFSRDGTSMGRVYSGGMSASVSVRIARPGDPPGPEFPDIPNHPPATHGTPATWFGAGVVEVVDATIEISSPQGRVTLVSSYVPGGDVGECEETATSSRMERESDNGSYRDVRLAAVPVKATIVRNGDTWTDSGTCYLVARVMYIKAKTGQIYGDASDLYATCTSANVAAARA